MVRRWSRINKTNQNFVKLVIFQNSTKNLNLKVTRKFFSQTADYTMFSRSKMLRRRHVTKYFLIFTSLLRWSKEYNGIQFFTSTVFTKFILKTNALTLNNFFFKHYKPGSDLLKEELIFSQIFRSVQMSRVKILTQKKTSNRLLVHASVFKKPQGFNKELYWLTKEMLVYKNQIWNKKFVVFYVFTQIFMKLLKSYNQLFTISLLCDLFKLVCLKKNSKVIKNLICPKQYIGTFF